MTLSRVDDMRGGKVPVVVWGGESGDKKVRLCRGEGNGGAWANVAAPLVKPKKKRRFRPPDRRVWGIQLYRNGENGDDLDPEEARMAEAPSNVPGLLRWVRTDRRAVMFMGTRKGGPRWEDVRLRVTEVSLGDGQYKKVAEECTVGMPIEVARRKLNEKYRYRTTRTTLYYEPSEAVSRCYDAVLKRVVLAKAGYPLGSTAPELGEGGETVEYSVTEVDGGRCLSLAAPEQDRGPMGLRPDVYLPMNHNRSSRELSIQDLQVAGRLSEVCGRFGAAAIVVELCCEPNSTIGQIIGREFRNIVSIRVTANDDLLSHYLKATLRRELETAGKPVLLFTAPPCTSGSTWQRVNAKEYPGREIFREKDMSLSLSLLEASVALYCELNVPLKEFAMEWPRDCELWRHARTAAATGRLDYEARSHGGCLQRAIFDGCSFGTLIRKPWRIDTTCVAVQLRFHMKLCQHSRNLGRAHEVGRGAAAKMSELYTPQLARALVQAFEHHVRGIRWQVNSDDPRRQQLRRAALAVEYRTPFGVSDMSRNGWSEVGAYYSRSCDHETECASIINRDCALTLVVASPDIPDGARIRSRETWVVCGDEDDDETYYCIEDVTVGPGGDLRKLSLLPEEWKGWPTVTKVGWTVALADQTNQMERGEDDDLQPDAIEAKTGFERSYALHNAVLQSELRQTCRWIGGSQANMAGSVATIGEWGTTGAVSMGLVARPVGKSELLSTPKAMVSLDAEWGALQEAGVWDPDSVQECFNVKQRAREAGVKIHIGSIHIIVVEKGSELPEGDPQRKYKSRAVFQGNDTRDEYNQAAMFMEMSSNPAVHEASRMADFRACYEDMEVTQSDCVRAYL
ncbi:MAG: hypothetical protein AAFN41_10025, partial [Planctomycetota bacterium]